MSTTSPTSRSTRPGDHTLVLDTRGLARSPGALMDVHRDAVLPSDIGVEFIRLPEGSTVVLDLLLTYVDEGILVTGPVRGRARIECVRCLGEFDSDVEVSLTEMYADAGTAAAAGAEQDEVRLLDGDRLDLEPALVDAFGLDFPMSPTCTDYGRDSCMDPDTPAPDGVSGAETDRIDPRWAGLAEKFGVPSNQGESE